MNSKKRIIQDICDLFKSTKGRISEAKIEELTALLDNYTSLIEKPVMLDREDFDRIVSYAKTEYTEKAFPKYLGNGDKIIGDYNNEAVNLCIIEATITLLNIKKCFKKLPKFDYR